MLLYSNANHLEALQSFWRSPMWAAFWSINYFISLITVLSFVQFLYFAWKVHQFYCQWYTDSVIYADHNRVRMKPFRSIVRLARNPFWTQQTTRPSLSFGLYSQVCSIPVNLINSISVSAIGLVFVCVCCWWCCLPHVCAANVSKR